MQPALAPLHKMPVPRKDSHMRFSRYILFSLLFAALAVPLAAQVSDTYVIPAVGNTPGDNGTVWATDLNIFNPQTYPLKVALVFLPTGGSTGSTLRFTVEANSNAVADNVLKEVFDASGTGSLLVATL